MTFPFTKDRYVHELVERDGDVCLVARTNQLTGSVHWEVVILQHRPAEVSPRGRRYPAREVYPGSETWGTYGWTFTTEAEARAKMAKACPHPSRRATGGGG